MDQRAFGPAGWSVPVLGLGSGHLGSPAQSEGAVGELLARTLELGLTLIDSAPGYGLAEERIGRHLKDRREEYLLVTKGGYGVPGVSDWTGRAIIEGVELALSKLRTDRIDVLLLHSCPREVLERGEVTEALARAVESGKVRLGGYSGENDALAYALEQPWCQVIETSVNLFDQRALESALPSAASRGIGVIAKRPLGNAPWRFKSRPEGHYAEVYWERMQALGLQLGELDFDQLALRFSAFAPGVGTAILGSQSPAHLERAAAIVAEGPLPTERWAAIRDSWRRHDPGWPGQV